MSTAASHEELCENLQRHGVLKAEPAVRAFQAVDRADFTPEDGEPYFDAAMVLGAGSQLSAPHVHASALELLVERLPEEGVRCHALDIGAGSGCMCTYLAHALLDDRGDVLAVEHIEELATAARDNIAKHHGHLLAEAGGNLEFRCADGVATARHPELAGRFRLVHCGAALAGVEPWLVDLLQPGGRAVAPIGPTDSPQWLCTVDKLEDGSTEVKRHIRVLYVPVIPAAAQRARGEHWDEVVARCVENSDAVLAQESEELYR